MKKIVLLFTLLLACQQLLLAQNTLRIQRMDGSVLDFAMYDNYPIITFEQSENSKANGWDVLDNLVIKTFLPPKITKVIIPLYTVRSYYFVTTTETGISVVENAPLFHLKEDGNVLIQHCVVPVVLYDTMGRLVADFQPDSGDEVLIPLSTYPVGTYIVKIGDNSYKVLRK